MRLLEKDVLKKVERLLSEYNRTELRPKQYEDAMNEIITFFDEPIYRDVLDVYYIRRNEYKNRYSNNHSILLYLHNKLYVQMPTLYLIRKEIVYKAAMIFFEYGIVRTNSRTEKAIEKDHDEIDMFMEEDDEY